MAGRILRLHPPALVRDSVLPRRERKGQRATFAGVKLSNETQPDPEALLARKSNAHPAQLSYRGHELMDNRHDLIVDCRVTRATDSGERDAAKEMSAELSGDHQKTIGTDKNNVSAVFGLHVIAYNLIRLGKLP
jgi:hypothetical protein